jgi:hypothetical protein
MTNPGIDAAGTAFAAGMCGVATCRIDSGEVFRGEDRIDALLWRLQANTIDEALLTKVLARQASAARKSG